MSDIDDLKRQILLLEATVGKQLKTISEQLTAVDQRLARLEASLELLHRSQAEILSFVIQLTEGEAEIQSDH